MSFTPKLPRQIADKTAEIARDRRSAQVYAGLRIQVLQAAGDASHLADSIAEDILMGEAERLADRADEMMRSVKIGEAQLEALQARANAPMFEVVGEWVEFPFDAPVQS